MVSSGFVPWYNRPAREYPVKRWLARRYGFTVPSSAFARETMPPAARMQRRRFPAQVWVEKRQAGG